MARHSGRAPPRTCLALVRPFCVRPHASQGGRAGAVSARAGVLHVPSEVQHGCSSEGTKHPAACARACAQRLELGAWMQTGVARAGRAPCMIPAGGRLFQRSPLVGLPHMASACAGTGTLKRVGCLGCSSVRPWWGRTLKTLQDPHGWPTPALLPHARPTRNRSTSLWLAMRTAQRSACPCARATTPSWRSTRAGGAGAAPCCGGWRRAPRTHGLLFTMDVGGQLLCNGYRGKIRAG